MKWDDLVAFVIAARETVSDEVALKAKELYKEWKPDTGYEPGDRRRFGDKLYKCRQVHGSEAQFTPDMIPALWEVIVEKHAGTLEDPIPYDPNMVVYEGLYYTYADVLYRCRRDSGVPLYAEPAALIGNYFDLV